MLKERSSYDNFRDYQFRKKYPELDNLDPVTNSGTNHISYSIYTENNVYIGCAMLYNIDNKNHEAEFGISITNKPFWNKGYGTIALNELLEIARQLGFKKIHSKTVTGNHRAIRYQEKCGFTVTGYKTVQGIYFKTLECTL